MGCPCQSNVSFTTNLFNGNNSNSQEDCGYTANTLISWKTTLECAKDSGRYIDLSLTIKDINIFLGNIISALNNNLCSFSTQLDQIQPYILNAINLNICQA